MGERETFYPDEFLNLLYSEKQFESVLQLITCSGGIKKKYLEHAQINLVRLGKNSLAAAAGWQKVQITFRDQDNLSPPHDPKSNIGANGKAKFFLAKRLAKDKSPICIALDSESIPSSGSYSNVLSTAPKGSEESGDNVYTVSTEGGGKGY